MRAQLRQKPSRSIVKITEVVGALLPDPSKPTPHVTRVLKVGNEEFLFFSGDGLGQDVQTDYSVDWTT